MVTKKELVRKIQTEVKWYARPRAIATRSKDDLEKIYKQAKKLRLLRKGKINGKGLA